MRIILAVDDEKIAYEAAMALVNQYRPQGAEVRVIHVLQPIAISVPPQMAAGYVPELAEEARRAEQLVNRVADTLRAAGFKVNSVVEKGEVRETIIDAADAWAADLIVLGSHGRKGARRFLLGSVAESVARHAPCSVEIVRSPAAA